jgi:hypothetical protein
MEFVSYKMELVSYSMKLVKDETWYMFIWKVIIMIR